jgi:hypothetical protein
MKTEKIQGSKIKEIEDSELWVKIKVREFEDRDGVKMMETKWVKADEEVSLGSMTKPNEKILEFKYIVPHEKPLFKRLFGE